MRLVRSLVRPLVCHAQTNQCSTKSNEPTSIDRDTTQRVYTINTHSTGALQLRDFSSMSRHLHCYGRETQWPRCCCLNIWLGTSTYCFKWLEHRIVFSRFQCSFSLFGEKSSCVRRCCLEWCVIRYNMAFDVELFSCSSCAEL